MRISNILIIFSTLLLSIQSNMAFADLYHRANASLTNGQATNHCAPSSYYGEDIYEMIKNKAEKERSEVFGHRDARDLDREEGRRERFNSGFNWGTYMSGDRYTEITVREGLSEEVASNVAPPTVEGSDEHGVEYGLQSSSDLDLYDDEISQTIDEGSYYGESICGNLASCDNEFTSDLPGPSLLPQENMSHNFTGPNPASNSSNDAANSAEQDGSDPVNPGTGEFSEVWTDFNLPGIGLSFAFQRIYRSGWEYNGPLGYNWNHNHNKRLISSRTSCGAERVYWMTGEGSVARFTSSLCNETDNRFFGSENSEGNGLRGDFNVDPHMPVKLNKIYSNELKRVVGWQIEHADGIRELYDSRGLLTEIIDLNFNEISYLWETSDRGEEKYRLKEATDTLNHKINFDYDDDGYLRNVSVNSVGVEVDFEIDENQDLVKFTNPEGIEERYSYSSGFPEDNMFAPSQHIVDYCSEQCQITGCCDESLSFCNQSAEKALTECVESCGAEETRTACNSSCVGACDEFCEEHEARTLSECVEECGDSCDALCANEPEAVCDKALEHSKCIDECDEECDKACGDDCDFYTEIIFNSGGIIPASKEAMIEILEFFGMILTAMGESLLCLANDDLYKWLYCQVKKMFGFDCSAEAPHCYQTTDQAYLDFCNNYCKQCCKYGESYYPGDEVCAPNTCQYHRDCETDCKNGFKYGHDVKNKSFYPEELCDAPKSSNIGCIERVKIECEKNCKTGDCVSSCKAACPGPCREKCNETCLDNCEPNCLEFDFKEACESSCLNSCVKTKSHPSGLPVFGQPQRGNHNLLTITDNMGDTYLENTYGTNIYSPEFDKVIKQRFGDEYIHFKYYDLITENAPEVDGSLVENKPSSLEICPVRNDCDDPEKCEDVYEEMISGFRANGAQPIANASMITDSDGGVWVYYSDKRGKVLRWINTETSESWNGNYDEKDRLIGQTRSFGDRTCYQYNENNNIIRITKTPSKEHSLNFEGIIDQKFKWGERSRMDEILMPNTNTTMKKFTWDERGNLRESWQAENETTIFTYDERGQVKTITLPNQSLVEIKHDMENGGWKQICEDALGPEPECRSAVRNRLGLIEYKNTSQGMEEAYKWLKDGRLIERTLKLDDYGEPVEYEYEYYPNGYLKSIASDESKTEYTYESRGYVESVVEQSKIGRAEGERTSCFKYNGRGQIEEAVKPEGNRVRFNRKKTGGLKSVESGNWSFQREAWEEDCLNNANDFPKEAETFQVFRWNNDGTLQAAIEEGVLKEYQYDGFGRLFEVRFGNGERTRYGYTELNQLSWAGAYKSGSEDSMAFAEPDVNDNGLASLTYYEYDLAGRMISSHKLWFENAGGPRNWLGEESGWISEYISYNYPGSEISFTRADGETAIVNLDSLGRAEYATLYDGSVVENIYSDFGRKILRRIPANSPSGMIERSIELTAFGQVRKVEASNGLELLSISYDDYGRAVEISRPESGKSFYYNGYGEIEDIFRLGTRSGEYEYETRDFNKNGLIIDYKDSLKRGAEYAYDYADRLIEELFTDGTSTSGKYAVGTERLRSFIDRNKNVLEYDYDELGLLSSLSVKKQNGASPLAEEYAYVNSLNGVVSGFNYQNGYGIAYSRDSLGNITKEEHLIGGQYWPVEYKHDSLSRIKEISYDYHEIKLSHEPLGRVSKVNHNDVEIAEYLYNGMGGADAIIYNNGIVENLTHDALGRVRKVFTAGENTTRELELYWYENGLLGRADYSFGNDGTTESSIYGYDALNRVEAETHGLKSLPEMASGRMSQSNLAGYFESSDDWKIYKYDNADNIISYIASDQLQSVTPETNEDNSYYSFGGSVETDDAGNALKLPDGTEHAYNGLDQLILVKKGNDKWEYEHDPFGRLVSWTGPQGAGSFKYAAGMIVNEISASGRTDYVPGSEGRPIAMLKDSGTYYYHYELGKRASVITDDSMNIVESYKYSSFGQPEIKTNRSEPIGNRLLIAGLPYFHETGMHKFGQRWHRPEWGRFITPDPAGYFDGPNLFAYVGNQPLAYYDPTGLGRRVFTDEQIGKKLSRYLKGVSRDLRKKGGIVNRQLAEEVDFVKTVNEWTLPQDNKEIGMYLTGGVVAKKAGKVGKKVAKSVSNDVHIITNWVANSRAWKWIRGVFSGGKGSGVVEGTSKRLPPLRQSYVDDVAGLTNKAAEMKKAGMSSEQIAKTLHAERNALKVKHRELTPADMLQKIEQRNLQKYGDKIGPSIEQLKNSGKSWDDIIESATRSGGKDLGF